MEVTTEDTYEELKAKEELEKRQRAEQANSDADTTPLSSPTGSENADHAVVSGGAAAGAAKWRALFPVHVSRRVPLLVLGVFTVIILVAVAITVKSGAAAPPKNRDSAVLPRSASLPSGGGGGGGCARVDVISRRATGRPNLLVIMTDQQRYDAITGGGASNNYNTVLRTPNIDRIAQTGASFTTALTQCPVCGPARTSLLSGRSIGQTRVLTNNDAEKLRHYTDVQSYDEVLVQMRGYVAEYYGKYHSPLDFMVAYRNNVTYAGAIAKSYQKYLDDVGIHRTARKDLLPGYQIQSLDLRPYRTYPIDTRHNSTPGSARNPDGSELSQPDQYGVSSIPAQHTLTAYIANETLLALDRLGRERIATGQPFSLTCSFHAPHAPMTPSEPYASMFAWKDMVPPSSINDTLRDSAYTKARSHGKVLKQYSDPDLVRYMMMSYYALVAEVDLMVGRILDKLDALGLTNDTLVVFTSDHGEMLGAHGMREKNIFLEESVRIPLRFSFPGYIPAGKVVDDPVSHIDVFATILDYLGVEQVDGLSDGKSLRRLVEDLVPVEGSGSSEEYVVSEWSYSAHSPNFMVRTKRWKLFLPLLDNSTVINSLYDLESDPYEYNNLLGNFPGRFVYYQEAEKLKAMLIEWLISVNSTHVDDLRMRNVTI
jgi:arylsulfatase A-like enzyme